MTAREWRRHVARQAPFFFLYWAARGALTWRQAFAGAWLARRFRLPTSFDQAVLYHVVIADEYGLRDVSLRADDVVVDVGAHVGCYALACCLRGSRRIVALEAHAGTAETLAHNGRRLPGVTTRHAAVFRSDLPNDTRLEHSGVAGANSGDGNVVFGGRAWVAERQSIEGPRANRSDSPAVALDDVLSDFERVRLLKLDCEGSEFPILLTARELHRVETIVGEYHEVTENAYAQLDAAARLPGYSEYRASDLVDKLRSAGFATEQRPTNPHVGLFRSERTAIPSGR